MYLFIYFLFVCFFFGDVFFVDFFRFSFIMGVVLFSGFSGKRHVIKRSVKFPCRSDAITI